MRAVMCLEDIGWGGTDKYGVLRPGQSPRPWVARLTGYTVEDWQVFGTFEREFLRGQRDFSRTNRSGSRGVFLYYALKPGLYEVNDRTSWNSVRRYYCVVAEDLGITEISREETVAWLARQTARRNSAKRARWREHQPSPTPQASQVTPQPETLLLRAAGQLDSEQARQHPTPNVDLASAS